MDEIGRVFYQNNSCAIIDALSVLLLSLSHNNCGPKIKRLSLQVMISVVLKLLFSIAYINKLNLLL